MIEKRQKNIKNMQKEIVIYSADICPYCMKAKALLEKKGVKYTEIKIALDDDDAREELITKTNGERTVPQIFVDGVHIAGGYTGLVERDNRGELNNILGI